MTRTNTLQAQDVRWKIDLRTLDRMHARLERLTVRGTLCAGSDTEILKARLLSAYRTETTRLGKLLVGEDGFIELEEVAAEVPDNGKYHLLGVKFQFRRITS